MSAITIVIFLQSWNQSHFWNRNREAFTLMHKLCPGYVIYVFTACDYIVKI